MTVDEVSKLICQRLQQQFSPSVMELVDETSKHYKHAGYQAGKFHFALTIASDCFKGIKRIEQHRMIYAALGDLMQTNIHALKIKVV